MKFYYASFVLFHFMTDDLITSYKVQYYDNSTFSRHMNCLRLVDEKCFYFCRLVSLSQSCRVVTSAFAFTSSCANPVLYTFAGKSYIKQNGFAFMARLFEGTSLDQTGNKKSRVTRKDNLGNSIQSYSTTAPISHNGVEQ